jgi:hypothetical protein
MKEITTEEASLLARRSSKYDLIITKVRQMDKHSIIQIDASEYPGLANPSNFGAGLQYNLRPQGIKVKVRVLAAGRGWLVQRLN